MSDNNKRAKIFIQDTENAKEYLNEIWDQLDYGMAFVAIDGTWLKVNPYLCEVLEYTESELLQRNFQQITHPEDLYDDQEMLEKLYEGKIDNYIMSKRYITKTGKLIWIKLKVTKILDKSGITIHYLSQVTPTIVIDSPDDHKFQVDLKKIAEKLELIEDTSILGTLKKNWRWTLSTSFLIIVFIIREGIAYNELQIMTKSAVAVSIEHERKIEKLENDIELLKKN